MLPGRGVKKVEWLTPGTSRQGHEPLRSNNAKKDTEGEVDGMREERDACERSDRR